MKSESIRLAESKPAQRPRSKLAHAAAWLLPLAALACSLATRPFLAPAATETSLPAATALLPTVEKPQATHTPLPATSTIVPTLEPSPTVAPTQQPHDIS